MVRVEGLRRMITSLIEDRTEWLEALVVAVSSPHPASSLPSHLESLDESPFLDHQGHPIPQGGVLGNGVSAVVVLRDGRASWPERIEVRFRSFRFNIIPLFWFHSMEGETPEGFDYVCKFSM